MNRILYFTFIIFTFSSTLKSQTPTDGFYMEKGEICTALSYSNSSWNQYWEGTLKRDNPNIGTFQTTSVNAMFNLGILNRVNLIVSQPWVTTSSTQGFGKGQSGLQDFGAWLKVRALDMNIGSSGLLGYLVGGVTTPASNYYPDFLPFSIGLGSTVLSSRGILHFETLDGWFIGAQGGYQHRSNITLDRDFYYIDRGFYTNEVYMYDVADYSANVGYRNDNWRITLNASQMTTLGGADMRRNEMPFPSYKMNMTQIGFNAQYRLPSVKGLGLLLNAGHVVSGRNVGQGTSIELGALYQGFLWNRPSKRSAL
jgi:hypothetical protein